MILYDHGKVSIVSNASPLKAGDRVSHKRRGCHRQYGTVTGPEYVWDEMTQTRLVSVNWDGIGEVSEEVKGLKREKTPKAKKAAAPKYAVTTDADDPFGRPDADDVDHEDRLAYLAERNARPRPSEY